MTLTGALKELSGPRGEAAPEEPSLLHTIEAAQQCVDEVWGVSNRLERVVAHYKEWGYPLKLAGGVRMLALRHASTASHLEECLKTYRWLYVVGEEDYVRSRMDETLMVLLKAMLLGIDDMLYFFVYDEETTKTIREGRDELSQLVEPWWAA